MSGTILKWGIPALLTVVGGTLAAVTTSGAAIPVDLQSRAKTDLADPAYGWASVSFDAQDAVLSGTATTQQAIDDATARLAAIHGVRTVVSNVVLAEYVSPFPFVATVADGHLTLSGGLPDEAARAEILGVAGQGATDGLRLMSGAPDRDRWLAAARYAVNQASSLDEGEVALADLDLTVSGRARSSAAYEQLRASSNAPQGVERGFTEIQPPLAAPFELHASLDNGRLNLTGVTPSAKLVSELMALAPDAMPVDANLALASGAPANFDADAKLLVQNLLKLERGSAGISDNALSLQGAPADPAAAESVRIAMTPSGAAVTLDPPRVAEYWLSAERNATGITLDGFVPDAAMRDRLEAMDKVDASGLELGRGAPESFAPAVDFVVGALERMSEGQATIQGTVVTLDGRAATLADYTAVQKDLQAAPQGLTLGAATVKPPLATPFTFTAQKSADGSYALTGYVPTEDVHAALRDALPESTEDGLVLADGNPDGFEADALNALQVLALLDSGRVAYDGSAWTISGAVDAAPKALAAEQAFATTGLRAAGWKYDVSLPKPEVVAAAPIVAPYVWRAQKSANGALLISGFAPTDAFKRYVAIHAGGNVTDSTGIGAGAPDTFVRDAMAGLDALLAMDQGAVGLTAGNWTLTGNVANSDARHTVEAALSAATDTSGWHVSIQAADAAPIVSPFTWAAAKAADGNYTLSGYVPTDALRQQIAGRLGKVAKDNTLVGSGEPTGFEADVNAGLAALQRLQSGKVTYNGHDWSIAGQPLTAADADAANAALDAIPDLSGWKVAFAEPSQAAPVPEAPVPEAPVVADAEPQTAPAAEPAEAAADTPAEAAPAEAPEAPADAATETPAEATPDVAEAPATPAEAVPTTNQPADAVPTAPADTAAVIPEQAAPAAMTPAAPEEPAAPADAAPATPESAPAEATPATPEPPAAKVAEVPAQPETPPAAPVVRNYVFEARKAIGAPVVLEGAVAADAMRDGLATITGTKPSAALGVNAGLPADFGVNVEAGTRALMLLSDGEVGLDGSQWVLSGRVASDADRQAVLAALADVPNLNQWQTDVTLLPPLLACQQKVGALQGRNAIVFESGSTKITEASDGALDELAGYLALCPEATVNVEGYTDSDGEADANLALSVFRAEAVVDALISRGIDAERLYAVGYGESLPIASNDTRAGKQANRRIAFTLTDE